MAELEYHKNLTVKTRLINKVRVLFKFPFLEQFIVRKVVLDPDSYWRKLIPQEYLYAPGSVRHYDRDGEKFDLDISKVVDHAKYFGLAEPAFDNLEDLIRKDFLILDIGANIGTTTVRFANCAIDGSVVAFEPSATTFSRLRRNLELNEIANVSCLQIGLGDQDGQFALYDVVETNPGMKRILPDQIVNEDYSSEQIQMTTVDSVVRNMGIHRVDLIKIDIEGFEEKALLGSRVTLKKMRPILFVELDDGNLKLHGSSAKNLMSFVQGFGYELFEAESMELISESTDLENCHIDVLCKPK